jgi:hypothetical protein
MASPSSAVPFRPLNVSPKEQTLLGGKGNGVVIKPEVAFLSATLCWHLVFATHCPDAVKVHAVHP